MSYINSAFMSITYLSGRSGQLELRKYYHEYLTGLRQSRLRPMALYITLRIHGPRRDDSDCHDDDAALAALSTVIPRKKLHSMHAPSIASLWFVNRKALRLLCTSTNSLYPSATVPQPSRSFDPTSREAACIRRYSILGLSAHGSKQNFPEIQLTKRCCDDIPRVLVKDNPYPAYEYSRAQLDPVLR